MPNLNNYLLLPIILDTMTESAQSQNTPKETCIESIISKLNILDINSTFDIRDLSKYFKSILKCMIYLAY